MDEVIVLFDEGGSKVSESLVDSDVVVCELLGLGEQGLTELADGDPRPGQRLRQLQHAVRSPTQVHGSRTRRVQQRLRSGQILKHTRTHRGGGSGGRRQAQGVSSCQCECLSASASLSACVKTHQPTGSRHQQQVRQWQPAPCRKLRGDTAPAQQHAQARKG